MEDGQADSTADRQHSSGKYPLLVDICAGHLVAKTQAKLYSRCQIVTDIRLNKTLIETLTHAIQSGELAAKYRGISFARLSSEIPQLLLTPGPHTSHNSEMALLERKTIHELDSLWKQQVPREQWGHGTII